MRIPAVMAVFALVASSSGVELPAGAADINSPSNTSPGGTNIGFQRDDAGSPVPSTQSGIQAGISGQTRAPDTAGVPGIGCPCPPGAAPGDLGEAPSASVVPGELEPSTGEFACICPGDTAFQGPILPPGQLPGEAAPGQSGAGIEPPSDRPLTSTQEEEMR